MIDARNIRYQARLRSQPRVHSTGVIARLDRATQYSAALVMKPRGLGVLGPRLRGDDKRWGAVSERAVSSTATPPLTPSSSRP